MLWLKNVPEKLWEHSSPLSNIRWFISKNELPEILTGNIITSVTRINPTNLLIDLALLVREKKPIEHMCEYKVVCSYDKVKRFKASAAVTASAPIHSYSGPKKP